MCKMTAPRHHKSSDRQLPTEGDGMAAECQQIAYNVLKDRLPPDWTFETFAEKSTRFSFFPVIVNGECVGAIIFSGHDVHAAIMPKARGRWFNKRIARWFNNQLHLYGKLTTKVMTGYRMGHEFAERLGFVVCGQNDTLTFYKKELT